MLFLNKNFITFLISLALAIFVSATAAAPADVNYPSNSTAEYHLNRRAFPTLNAIMGEKPETASDIPFGPYTEGLVTCFGVGITGTGSKEIRFLVHIPAVEFMLNDQWSQFEQKVRGAGVTNMRGYMSAPESCDSDIENWDSLRDESDRLVTILTSRLSSLTGNSPTVVNRPVRERPQPPQGTMQIDSNNRVSIQGRPVS